jgi:hypothetical protein
MNTWTDSGLSEAGLIGAMLAIGVEARLPDGPTRSSHAGSRHGEAARRDEAQRGGRRRAAESEIGMPSVDRGLVAAGVPAVDYADPHSADSYSADSYSADSFPAVPQPSSLTGSFPLSGVAKLYTPEPVPLPSEPLPSEPRPSELLPSEPLPSELLSSEPLLSAPVASSPRHGDRDGLHSSTDGFLAGGFSSSSTDSPWDVDSGSGEHPSGSWSRPVPLTPPSAVSPAVSAPTSLLPMPKTPASHRAEATGFGRHAGSDVDEQADETPRDTFTVESSTLGSLDSSGLFAALSRRG